MVDHDDEKTQILSDPGDLGLDDDENEKTRMIDPSVLAGELDSSRKESATGKDGKPPAPAHAPPAPPPPVYATPRAPAPPPPPRAPAPPPPAPGPEDFDKTRDAPWRATGQPPPHPPPAPHNKPSAQKPKKPAAKKPDDGGGLFISKLKFRPDYEDTDLTQTPLHKLKKMLNEAEGRMVMHETELFQLEELQGEIFKAKPGDAASAEGVRKLSDQRDNERERMRSALVDVQIVSEAMVKAFNQREARQLGISVEEFMQRRRKDHELTVMPWYFPDGDLKRIRITMGIGVIIGVLIAFLIPTVDVPPKLASKTVIPDNLAQLVLARKKLPPPPPPPTLKPKPEPKPEKKAEQPKPKPPEETRIKPKPRPEKPRTEAREQAREKAKNVGINKTASLLENLATASRSKALKNLGVTSGLTTGGKRSRKKTRKITTASSGRGGGIRVKTGNRSTGDVGKNIGSGTVGSEIKSSISVQQSEEIKNRELGASNASGRSDQEIQLVFDKNQSRLYRIYQKELRKNPALRGQVVFELKISAQGKVVSCKVISSDLSSPLLEEALVIRIKLMKFAARPGGKTETIKYPIDFLPS